MKQMSLFCMLLFTIIFAAAQNDGGYPAGLKAGDTAPDFSIAGTNNTIFHLKSELKKGPVVLVFYRGQWCPYCNKYLRILNDSLLLIKEKGATVVAISPEVQENIGKTIRKTKAGFPVLHDTGMAVMKSYKVNFAVDERTVEQYKGYGIDFNVANGSNGTNLPVPATYVIGKNGIIAQVFFNTDYRRRPSVKEILDNL